MASTKTETPSVLLLFQFDSGRVGTDKAELFRGICRPQFGNVELVDFEQSSRVGSRTKVTLKVSSGLAMCQLLNASHIRASYKFIFQVHYLSKTYRFHLGTVLFEKLDILFEAIGLGDICVKYQDCNGTGLDLN